MLKYNRMKLGINQVIRKLILADFFLQAGWGFIGPIFAIFIIQQIRGGELVTIGFVVATYWISKSLVQPFIGYYLDTRKGEKDDFDFLIKGMFVANLIPLGYLLSTEIWQILLLELIRGIAMACATPSWAAIFTRHIDKGWEAISWSIESTLIGFAFGFSALFGGIIASTFGFKAIFILVSAFGLFATFLLFFLRRKLPVQEKPF